VNESLLEPLHVRRFVNLHKDFDADDGEITRTRKLRRNVIEERYQALITALYSGTRSVVENTRITYETGQTGTISRMLSICEVA
jgi:long-chain acyl-CoA synthetase